MNAANARGWWVALAIFLLGIAVGCAGTVWVGVRAVRRVLQAPPAAMGPADRSAQRIGADLTKLLALTAEQSARVQAVLNESARRLKEIRADSLARAQAELRQATERIAAELPADKHAEFLRIVARRYERLGLTPPTVDALPVGRK